MENAICVTRTDYQRILNVIGTTSGKPTGFVGVLMRELERARMVAPAHVPGNVVTMNSRVLVREVVSGRVTEITVTYPDDAAGVNGKVSVLSPIGIALFGGREGDIARWRTPSGIGEFKIEKVVYQPEASGHYHL